MMIYTRTQATPDTVSGLQTIFDMTIRNNEDGVYEVNYRVQDACAILQSKSLSVVTPVSAKDTATDLLFLALYGALGKEHCEELLRKHKKDVVEGKVTKQPKVDPTGVRMAYGKGTRCAVGEKKRGA